MLGVAAYAGAVSGFHKAANLIGRDAMIAFAWSFGALLVALLISAQKASWLPRKMWPRWRNGNGEALAVEPNAAANGLSADASS
jgi:ABC-type spermidine/putrescine transport system permease subunit II